MALLKTMRRKEKKEEHEKEIGIDAFGAVELRAAKVLACEKIPKAKKLLKLQIDLGYEQRQIVSGIANFYEPEDLIGKTAIAILNLPPRKMMGVMSNGMLISAIHKEKGEEKVNLLLVDDKIPAGAKLC